MSENFNPTAAEMEGLEGTGAEPTTPTEDPAAIDPDLAGLVEGGAPDPEAPQKPKRKGGGKKKEKKEKEPKEKKPPRDNIARVNAMTSIADVRKAKQVAVAKKAKASKNPDSVARYEKEIEAAQARLDELLAASPTVQDLINNGEDPNRIITAFIKQKEDEFETFSAEHKASKKLLKAISDEIPASFYLELPTSLHDALNARFDKSDYRLKATCRNVNLMEAVKEGTIVHKDGKWYDAEGNQIGREAKAEDTAGEGEEPAGDGENTGGNAE